MGWWSFLGLNRLGAPFSGHYPHENLRKSFNSCFEVSKMLPGNIHHRRPYPPLTMLIGDGLVEFSEIESVQSPIGASLFTLTPMKNFQKSPDSYFGARKMLLSNIHHH